MKKIFNCIKSAFKSIKNLFKKKKKEKEEELILPIVELDTDNAPVDPENVKLGEIGGYVIYNRTIAKINAAFIKNLQDLGINILYFNTPRDKKNPDTFLSYDEMYSIFEKFRDSGIKLMIYIYETLAKKDSDGNIIYNKWTDKQIKSISNHPAFYGWIAEDEVSYAKFKTSLAWINTFHNQKLNGERKWPNMSITFLPKLKFLKADAIGETYDDYLELWSQSADIVFADQYPIISSKVDGAQYNVDTDGTDVYSSTSGKESWYNYLKAHLNFTNNHPELVHRLYMHTCKEVSKDDKGKSYIQYPKPTELATRIQAYANLMAGSNGLMLFVLGDIGDKFTKAAFSKEFLPNDDTFNVLSNVFNNKIFKNFKELIVNLKIDNFMEYDENLLTVIAHNNKYFYHIFLNISLDSIDVVNVPEGYKVLNLEDSTVYTYPYNISIHIEPGNISCIKIEK